MRFRKRIREGVKRERGVAVRGRGEIGMEGVRGGDSGEDGAESKLVPIGLDRSEVLRRRTGPGPGSAGSGRRERSAMSHGFVSSGAASSAVIQGSWSKP